MEKEKAIPVVKDFEWIEKMTAEFALRSASSTAITPDEASWWQLRILLSIAQQLSVIAATLKETERLAAIDRNSNR
jgi:hypothetical protein